MKSPTATVAVVNLLLVLILVTVLLGNVDVVCGGLLRNRGDGTTTLTGRSPPRPFQNIPLHPGLDQQQLQIDLGGGGGLEDKDEEDDNTTNNNMDGDGSSVEPEVQPEVQPEVGGGNGTGTGEGELIEVTTGTNVTDIECPDDVPAPGVDQCFPKEDGKLPDKERPLVGNSPPQQQNEEEQDPVQVGNNTTGPQLRQPEPPSLPTVGETPPPPQQKQEQRQKVCNYNYQWVGCTEPLRCEPIVSCSCEESSSSSSSSSDNDMGIGIGNGGGGGDDGASRETTSTWRCLSKSMQFCEQGAPPMMGKPCVPTSP
jgi:hypothetical protein